MEKSIKGKAFVLGNNIDTDQIIPAEHLVYSLNDPKESQLYGRYALSGVPLSEAGLPGGNIPFIKGEETVSEYSIVIGGSNFGCGSSREHAPFALMTAGVNNVISTNDEVEIIIDDNMRRRRNTMRRDARRPSGACGRLAGAGNLFEYA